MHWSEFKDRGREDWGGSETEAEPLGLAQRESGHNMEQVSFTSIYK